MTASVFMLRTRTHIVLAILAAVSLGFFLFVSSRLEGPGFPLDDAWIHQTYARNLAQQGEWSFIPGQPSAGSTAPLWSAILAIGYGLKLNPILWVYLLGWLHLWLLGLVTVYGLKLFIPEQTGLAPWGGVVMLFEFHLVWAAGSGMETLLDAILLAGFLIWLSKPDIHWFGMGLWIGLSVWVRPDGITLLGPAMMVLALGAGALQEKFVRTVRLAGGLFLCFGPYLLFNRVLAGAWWPNTFFAKQAEYAILIHQPLLARFANQLVLPLVGIGIVLLPGFIWRVYRSIRKRQWAYLAGAIWLVGFLFLYAWRLPVTYQHGRYVIPVMPVYFVWGLAGFLELADLRSKIPLRRILSRAWLLTGGIVIFFFWFRGAVAYAQDVAVIQTEMVATATWVADHTPPDALIAAHDIGALGYYANRQLLDLAGLISPEVIPFMRDEDRLARYLDQQKVDFLVTFPGWYPDLIKNAVLIHSTDGKISPSLGGENMKVFRWSGSAVASTMTLCYTPYTVRAKKWECR